jgi:PAS domain S-box-containing protein
MKPLAKQNDTTETFLSVSYKATQPLDPDSYNLCEAVIITTTKFYITGFNKLAELLFDLSQTDYATATLGNTLPFTFKNTSPFKALLTIYKTGTWSGEITYLNSTGQRLNFYTIANLIENNSSVVISNKIIVEEENKNHLPIAHTTESLFGMFMENSQTGCWIYDENDRIVFCNKAYGNSFSIGNNPTGKHLSEIWPKAFADQLIARNKILLKTGRADISEYSLTKQNGDIIHFVSNAFIFKTADGKRFIGGQAIDITDRKNTETQIEKMHERFTYAVNSTSEAIWDLDLKTNEIYRSDAFYKISGYSKEQLGNNLEWWFDKIHPDDKERVKNNFTQDLLARKKNWSDEYRFQYADGTYRSISDKGFAIYEEGKPVRLFGAIRDITEQKKLEKQLINEQVKKQKLINQATIEAQEKERGMISAELHDNVNQLLMSARLHIGAAKNNDDQTELLDKASMYLLEAVEEIRGLSKRLNTSIVRSVGLEQSILDICRNMQQFSDITVDTAIDKNVVDKLTQEQQLIIFRITQEQSNNIIKYSRASSANISVTEKNNQCCLIISDNGIGFDKEKQKANGIGFINIFNRVDAYNGKVEINTYPDNGCTLNITIPYII